MSVSVNDNAGPFRLISLDRDSPEMIERGGNRDLLNRITHALLMALPERIDVDANTFIRFIRANDPDEIPEGDDPAEVPSPLFVHKETMFPEILIVFECRDKFSVLFHLQQCGGVQIGGDLAPEEVFPAVPDPIDNPQ